MALTDNQLAAIQAREQAATPGPWTCGDIGYVEGLDVVAAIADEATGSYYALCTAGDLRPAKGDAEFIAHARSDVPLLLVEVCALRAERDRYKAAVDRLIGAGASARAESWSGCSSPLSPWQERELRDAD